MANMKKLESFKGNDSTIMGQRFNQIRKFKQGCTFSTKEMHELFIKANFPKSLNFIFILAKLGALIKYREQGSKSMTWKFTDKPIHYGIINSALRQLKTRMIKEPKAKIEKVRVEEMPNESDQINAAIQLLKSHGYMVLQPVTTYHPV